MWVSGSVGCLGSGLVCWIWAIKWIILTYKTVTPVLETHLRGDELKNNDTPIGTG